MLQGEVQMRLYRISFVAGFAAGFVAGTRAGREKYDQMVKMAKAAAENPTVQQAAGTIQSQASSLASTAAQKVGSQLHDKVPPFAHSAAHTVADRIHGIRHRDSSASDHRAASNGYPFATTGDSQGTQGGSDS
jgi:hypothetical protein